MPTKEDREDPGGSQLIWKWYAEKMFRLILERHSNAEEIHLINDRYDVDLSIKKCEQGKRSASYTGGSRNNYPKMSQVLHLQVYSVDFSVTRKIRFGFKIFCTSSTKGYWMTKSIFIIPSTNGVTI